MSKGTEKSSFFEKLATVIVDKRNLIFFLYACALIFCLFSRNWVSVCNDITEYLPDEPRTTRRGTDPHGGGVYHLRHRPGHGLPCDL